MSRFAVLAVLALVGCSDTVAEYNKQKELLVNLRIELNAMEDRINAYGEEHFPAYAKKKLGLDQKALDEARSRVGRDNVLTTTEKLERLNKIDDDELRIAQLKDKAWTRGTPEWKEFNEVVRKWPEYARIVALRDRIATTEESILKLESKLPR